MHSYSLVGESFLSYYIYIYLAKGLFYFACAVDEQLIFSEVELRNPLRDNHAMREHEVGTVVG